VSCTAPAETLQLTYGELLYVEAIIS